MMALAFVLVTTFAFAAGATWTLARFRGRWSVLDYPAAHSIHTVPVPRTGGLAMILALVVGALSCAILGRLALGDDAIAQAMVAFTDGVDLRILLLTFVLAVVSAVDDRYRIPAVPRLLVHFAIALGVVFWAGLSFSHVSVPTVWLVGLGWLGTPITVLFVVWMVNLFNFMDGLDGLAAGTGAIGFTALAAVSWRSGSLDLGILGLLIAAASAGFLTANLPPARIFMGDVGSTVLGFLAAAFALRAANDQVFEVWIPILAFSPFIVDATVTLVVRALKGRPLFTPHREHYYQRLVLAGWPHRRTLLAEYALCVAGAVAAISYAERVPGVKIAILGATVALYVVLAAGIHLVERRARGSTR